MSARLVPPTSVVNTQPAITHTGASTAPVWMGTAPPTEWPRSFQMTEPTAMVCGLNSLIDKAYAIGQK